MCDDVLPIADDLVLLQRTRQSYVSDVFLRCGIDILGSLLSGFKGLFCLSWILLNGRINGWMCVRVCETTGLVLVTTVLYLLDVCVCVCSLVWFHFGGELRERIPLIGRYNLNSILQLAINHGNICPTVRRAGSVWETNTNCVFITFWLWDFFAIVVAIIIVIKYHN